MILLLLLIIFYFRKGHWAAIFVIFPLRIYTTWTKMFKRNFSSFFCCPVFWFKIKNWKLKRQPVCVDSFLSSVIEIWKSPMWSERMCWAEHYSPLQCPTLFACNYKSTYFTVVKKKSNTHLTTPLQKNLSFQRALALLRISKLSLSPWLSSINGSFCFHLHVSALYINYPNPPPFKL
jgi:hypothetical protein